MTSIKEEFVSFGQVMDVPEARLRPSWLKEAM